MSSGSLARVRRVQCVHFFLLVTVGAGACHRPSPTLTARGESAVALSGGSNASMIYVARTSAGVLTIDLGWWRHSESFTSALASIGATPADVRWVFLTHSHRDHIAGWPEVKQARFVLAADELPRLFGAEHHRGWIPRFTDRVRPPRLPHPGEIATTTFASDTTFVFGTDTLRAYIVPGHTAGSAVYLFRGVLFVGDAMTWSRLDGFSAAKPGFSDDPALAARNLDALWPRLPRGSVHYLCTAHARCAPINTRH